MKKFILITILASFLTPSFAQNQSNIDDRLSIVILNTIYGPAESLQKIISNTAKLLKCRELAIQKKDLRTIKSIDSNLRISIPIFLKQMDSYLISLQANNMAPFYQYLSPDDSISIDKIRQTISCAKQEYQLTLTDLK
ncbi:MAG: hypothetical protein WCK37_03110 [Candidatus Falkowbacteria bacterium]